MSKPYQLSYLPMARQDIFGLALYVANQLQAPGAALRLADELDGAISRLAEFPYAYPVYRLIRPLATEYRMLPVGNYRVFYTVQEGPRQVEIHRVLYARMDVTKRL